MDNVRDMHAKGRFRAPGPEGKARRNAAISATVRSPETRERMRQAQLGKKYSQETIDKRRAKVIGIKRSEETRQKLRDEQARRKLARAAVALQATT